MNAYTEALMKELAPVILTLVQVEVAKAVDAKVQARDLVVPIWRGHWAPGMVCGVDSVVEHRGRLYLAREATTREPAADSADWQLHADREH